MPSWTNATPEHTPAGVILHPELLDRHVARQVAPSAGSAALVERFWRVRWDLAGLVTVPGSLVPSFSVNLTWEVGSGRPGTDGQAVLTGVPTRRFDATLTGCGSVVGIKFRPGAFTGVSGVPAGRLTDRTVPAAGVLPAALVAAFTAAATAPDTEQVDRLDRTLDSLQVLDPQWVRARDAVQVASDPAVLSVAALAGALGTTVRTLQRLTQRYLGVGPKQVITRLRLHDAVAALHAGWSRPLADLAADLGFFDQAHFTREFTRFVGVPPARYLTGAPLGPSRS